MSALDNAEVIFGFVEKTVLPLKRELVVPLPIMIVFVEADVPLPPMTIPPVRDAPLPIKILPDVWVDASVKLSDTARFVIEFVMIPLVNV